jgi:hypothetical protein
LNAFQFFSINWFTLLPRLPPRTNSVFLVASKLKYQLQLLFYFQCQLNPDAPIPVKIIFSLENRSKLYATDCICFFYLIIYS